MKLGIISDCIHYKDHNNRVGTENHILLRQFEQLSGHFSATTVACAFGTIDEKKVISWYSKDIKFIALPNVGGDTLKDKFKLLKAIPKWINSFKKIDRFADVVYQRFPNNLNIPGFFYFFFKRKKVFATYTGTWPYFKEEPLTYKLQKWFLKKWFRGPVWVYTDQPTSNQKIISGFSPSYSRAEWNEETDQVNERIKTIEQHGIKTFRLVSVGKLIDYKNQLTILKACSILKQQNFPFTLKIVGDGPMETVLKNFIRENDLQNECELAGKKNYQELRALYRSSDFVVQAPLMEGFGKVPIEGLFHGVIPVLNNVSMAKFMTANEERGFLFDAADAANLANKLIEIRSKISILPSIIKKGRAFAQTQTLEDWAAEYYEKVSEFYQ